jgi:hypothetical protein
MATNIYKNKIIKTVDGLEIEIVPLKIKYLRQFMEEFENIKKTKNDDEAISVLVKCAVVCMKQYYTDFKTVEDVEDNFDIKTIYEIIDIGGGIKIKGSSEDTVKNQATDSGSSWETLDLAKLESEAFLLGIWKDYNELELSLSMPELMSVLEIKREIEYEEKKFMAAIQGVDLDKASGKSRGQKEWEDMKARVFSKGKAKDSDDVLSLQGANAQKYGFGIGMGIDYEDLTK